MSPLSEEALSHRWRAAAGVRAQGLSCLMLWLSGDQLLFIFPPPPGARQQTRDGGRGERNIRGIGGSGGQKGGGGREGGRDGAGIGEFVATGQLSC